MNCDGNGQSDQSRAQKDSVLRPLYNLPQRTFFCLPCNENHPLPVEFIVIIRDNGSAFPAPACEKQYRLLEEREKKEVDEITEEVEFAEGIDAP